MRTESTIEAVSEAEAEPLSIDLSKLLGFQHIAADTADEAFLEKAAAIFNKIGDAGEGPIIIPPAVG